MRGAGPARDGRRFNHGLTTVFAIVRRRRRDSGRGSERPPPHGVGSREVSDSAVCNSATQP